MLHTSMDSSLGGDCNGVNIISMRWIVHAILTCNYIEIDYYTHGKAARIVMLHTRMDCSLGGDCNDVNIISMRWIVHAIMYGSKGPGFRA